MKKIFWTFVASLGQKKSEFPLSQDSNHLPSSFLDRCSTRELQRIRQLFTSWNRFTHVLTNSSLLKKGTYLWIPFKEERSLNSWRLVGTVATPDEKSTSISHHPQPFLKPHIITGVRRAFKVEDTLWEQKEHKLCYSKVLRAKQGSISVSGQLPTFPSPDPTLTLTCYQLTVVE